MSDTSHFRCTIPFLNLFNLVMLVRLRRLQWPGHVNEMEKTEIHKETLWNVASWNAKM